MKQRKLNFLLVSPRIVQTTGDGYAFPLGIAYVSASLKAAGFTVFTSNLNHIGGNQNEALKQLIEEHDIDVIGTGGLSFQYSTVFDIVKSSKQIKPTIITIVGGGMITAEPDVALKALEYADYGIIGEGELSTVELATALENGLDVSVINGLVYKKDGNIIQTPKRREIEDLDSLPWPDYDGFNFNEYLKLPSVSINNMVTKRMAYMAGSRSCPYACSFCFHSTGRRYRQRSMDKVLEEISYVKEKYDIGFVYMVDELFARDQERVFAFIEKMDELAIPWSASFRVDDVTPELIDGLKGSTCAAMMFGLESADNKILKSMRKGIKIEQIENALKLAYDANIPTAGNFIFGDIEETAETANNTLTWWENHTDYNIGLNLINTYPGARIYKYACEQNLITDKVQFLKDGCPQINISKLSENELGTLCTRIFEAPYKTGKRVDDVRVHQIQPTGHISFSGKCTKCGSENDWNDIKLFVGNSWVPCTSCGQKHNVPIPSEVMQNISKNIERLLDTSSTRVAMWGLTYYSLRIFSDIPIFQDDRVVLIDNARAKQQMRIHEKSIHSPQALTDLDIETVVVFYPNSIKQIESIIDKHYRRVNRIIDISTFICEPEFC